MSRPTRQEAIGGFFRSFLKVCARLVLDFALPRSCFGWGTIVPDVRSFRAECWKLLIIAVPVVLRRIRRTPSLKGNEPLPAP
jgi:hypothetical protein